jgi:hypothetical protein
MRGMLVVALAAASCGPGAQGSGGDAGAGGAGSCAMGSAAATAHAIVSGLDQPFAIAVDDTAVYFTETGSRSDVERADKSTGGNVVVLADEPLNAPEERAVDGQWVYYRTPTLKRVAKTMPAMPTVLATGYDDLHSRGLFAGGGQVFFAGTDTMGHEVIMRIDADGTNATQLASAATPIHLVGLDAANLYYALDTPTHASQLAVARGGGTPAVLATGEACFDGGIDATYLYCAGVSHPFKVKLAGVGGQIALCPADLTRSNTTDGNLAVAKGHFFVMSIPHGDPVTMAPNSGRVLEVSPFGGGNVLATGVDDPFMVVTDGSALYYTENRLGTLMKIDLP